MYSDWVSLFDDIVGDSRRAGVLEIFPDFVGHEVSKGVAKALAQTISLDSDRALPSKLSSPFEVKWTLEVNLIGVITNSLIIIRCANV